MWSGHQHGLNYFQNTAIIPLGPRSITTYYSTQLRNNNHIFPISTVKSPVLEKSQLSIFVTRIKFSGLNKKFPLLLKQSKAKLILDMSRKKQIILIK